VQFLGVLTRYSTYCFLVIMTVKCYFLLSSVSPVSLQLNIGAVGHLATRGAFH
jgi:hypothetical protein